MDGKYYFQVCSEVSAHCGDSEAAVCIKSLYNSNVTHNAGAPDALWQDRTENEDEGVTVIYSNGEVCGADGSRRKTIVTLKCYLNNNPWSVADLQRRDIDPFSVPSYIESVTDDGCTARLTVLTPFACATNKNYTSTCSFRSTKEACFVGSSNGECECAWCESSCVATYEKCSGLREFQCAAASHSHITIMVLPLLVTLLVCSLLTCLCCCMCASRKRQLKNKLENKLRLPQRNNEQNDFAMQPLMMPITEPQYMYVQYPMPGGQQHPPFFAPNPIFVVPQYSENMQ